MNTRVELVSKVLNSTIDNGFCKGRSHLLSSNPPPPESSNSPCLKELLLTKVLAANRLFVNSNNRPDMPTTKSFGGIEAVFLFYAKAFLFLFFF